LVMCRFVILEHDFPIRHWDLMLEAGAVLRTWRLSSPPTPAAAITAEPIGDHRYTYLDYEGPVSGGRGSVARWDWGVFDWLEDGHERIVVHLEGIRLRGTFRLEQTSEGWRAILDCEDPA